MMLHEQLDSTQGQLTGLLTETITHDQLTGLVHDIPYSSTIWRSINSIYTQQIAVDGLEFFLK